MTGEAKSRTLLYLKVYTYVLLVILTSSYFANTSLQLGSAKCIIVGRQATTIFVHPGSTSSFI
jgi:hypothetical protein